MARTSPVNTDTLLVAMPFFSASSPSLAIGLLAAIGRREGFVVDTAHFTLDFAARVGLDTYEAICRTAGSDLGNWLFAVAAFGEDAPDPGDRFPYERPEALAGLDAAELDAAELVRLRREVVPEYLAGLEAASDWSRYSVVGFTTTFEQNVASLALARRLKSAFPHLVIIFGGANCAGEMGRELVSRCDCIDYVVDGEGDEVFAALLRSLETGGDPATLPGVMSRGGSSQESARPAGDLAVLPTPEFEVYFHRAESLNLFDGSLRSTLRLPFEASRGCWWGQKHHCTFCGLNGQFMTFRQKSSTQVLNELAELARRYSTFRFAAVDNILPNDFLTDFLPKLAEEERNYDIFFEIKSNLDRADVRLLRDAGVNRIQPGIESFSSDVLRLMRKGVTAIQNVNLLRWARYYGIDVAWNILWGFPSETVEHYAAQVALIHHLPHLQPPLNASRVDVQRFSPFHFDRERFPARRISEGGGLKYVYPLGFDLAKIAFFFEHEFEGELPDAAFGEMRSVVEAWRAAWLRPTSPRLTYRWSPGLLHVEDARGQGPPMLYAFDGPVAEIYRAVSDRPMSVAMVASRITELTAVEDIRAVLDLFVAQGLVMLDQGQYLALAIPDRTY